MWIICFSSYESRASIQLLHPCRSRHLLGSCRLPCSREIWRAFLKECGHRFFGFWRAYSRGKLLVLSSYRIFDLLSCRTLHQRLACLKRAWRLLCQLLCRLGSCGEQRLVRNYSGHESELSSPFGVERLS